MTFLSRCYNVKSPSRKLCCLLVALLLCINISLSSLYGQSRSENLEAGIASPVRTALAPAALSDAVPPSASAQATGVPITRRSGLGGWLNDLGLTAAFELSGVPSQGLELAANLTVLPAGVRLQPYTWSAHGSAPRPNPQLILAPELEDRGESDSSLSSLMYDCIASLKGATSTRLDLDAATQVFLGVGKIRYFGVHVSFTHRPFFGQSRGPSR
ncbi:MAG: hypothetical protein JSV86_09055 [Gemmatimonadota bacterium]|nr:MAG: hypothetical protein JSV86_09055 [Gemmatimonadota bacterium]